MDDACVGVRSKKAVNNGKQQRLVVDVYRRDAVDRSNTRADVEPAPSTHTRALGPRCVIEMGLNGEWNA